MNNDWIVLVIALPLFAGIATTFLRGRLLLQRTVGLATLATLIATQLVLLTKLAHAEQPLVSSMGSWPAPYGIAIVFDGLAGALLLVAATVATAAYLTAFSLLDERLERGWFHPLFHLLVLGINFSFITGDLFNLFVAFEIMLMASYGLMCLGGSKHQLSQAFKYVILNLVGSTIFVLSAGLIYGLVGTLNYADLARIAIQTADNGQTLPAGFQPLALCLLFVFCLKAAVFPLWFWLPDTYHTMPAPLGALFAALLSKVGVYAILRLFPSVFAMPELTGLEVIHAILPALAGTTMVLAILAACAAHGIRRIIAMVLISHVGYLIFGISLMTPDAFAAAFHYMAQEMLVIAALFIAAGVVAHRAGTTDIRQLGGLHKPMPLMAALVFILAITMVGIPPLSGFFGKAVLIKEGLANNAPVLTAALILNAILTLVAMGRLFARLFWSPLKGPGIGVPNGAQPGPIPVPASAYAAVAGLTAASIAIGLFAQPTFTWAQNSTKELTRPDTYIAAVLKPPPPQPPHTHNAIAHATTTQTPAELTR